MLSLLGPFRLEQVHATILVSKSGSFCVASVLHAIHKLIANKFLKLFSTYFHQLSSIYLFTSGFVVLLKRSPNGYTEFLGHVTSGGLPVRLWR